MNTETGDGTMAGLRRRRESKIALSGQAEGSDTRMPAVFSMTRAD